MKKKVAFQTLGCKLNYAESSTYEREFIELGYEIVPWREKADAYIINTCTVTAQADKKSRNIIRKLHKESPDAAIVVTGCSAQLRKDTILKIDGVSLIFGAEDKSSLVKDTDTLLHGGRPENIVLTQKENIEKDEPKSKESAVKKVIFEKIDRKSVFPAYSEGERTRSFLKIQDGCDNFCAYCTIPFARGRSRNIPAATIIKQANEIAASGIKEIVITGINTGDFGRSTGESFLDLLKELNKVEGIERYRISSIEPNLLTEEIVDWIASGTKFLPHFHIPLQSGSDELLKTMGRKYTTSFFLDKINEIRSKMNRPGKPQVFFGIDVIVGLPGESDELFEQTYNFLKDEVKPAFIHIFPYSRRVGTRAANMKNQVDAEVKKARVAKLEELCEQLHSDFVEANKGLEEKVLYEDSVKDGMMSGYTENYIRIERPYDPDLVGKIVSVTI